jgi:hypothetical protein
MRSSRQVYGNAAVCLCHSTENETYGSDVCVQAGSGGVLGAGRLQAMLAALLSVKIISKLSR